MRPCDELRVDNHLDIVNSKWMQSSVKQMLFISAKSQRTPLRFLDCLCYSQTENRAYTCILSPIIQNFSIFSDDFREFWTSWGLEIQIGVLFLFKQALLFFFKLIFWVSLDLKAIRSLHRSEILLLADTAFLTVHFN